MSTSEASDVPYFILNDGHKMPGIGKGYVPFYLGYLIPRFLNTRTRCWFGPGGGRDVAEEICRIALKVNSYPSNETLGLTELLDTRSATVT